MKPMPPEDGPTYNRISTSEIVENVHASAATKRGGLADAQIKRRKGRSWETLRGILLLDLLVVMLFTTLAIVFSRLVMEYRSWPERESLIQNELVQFVFITSVAMYLLWLCQTYDWHVRFDANQSIARLARMAGYLSFLTGVMGLSFGSVRFIITGILTAPIIAVLLFAGRKLTAAKARQIRQQDPSRIAIVGAVRDINRILSGELNKKFPFRKFEVILVTDYENIDRLRKLEGVCVLPFRETEDLAEVISQHTCEAALIATVTDFDEKELRRLAWSVRDLNVRLYLEPMLGGISGARVSCEMLGTRSVLLLQGPRFRGANGIQKRMVDIVFSSIILLCLTPIFILVAIAIKLEDGGSVLYYSERIGRHGKPFKMWKFRSMVPDADKMVERLANETGQDLLLFKMRNDPRVTRVGRFIRKTSIDELPQFINSLNGTMSVVGPRPPLRREVEKYSPDMRMRLEVKPGITGLWQVNGRSDLTIEQAENLDLYYADNWSAGLDIATFLRTFSAVLSSRGAY
ncbi:sugar transferase [Corynebacterium auriscanis]|uniref:sugar transferase n=1 Tax=Corynebacterium auriscanis TaxID=99807 RepID=UPI003CED9EDD